MHLVGKDPATRESMLDLLPIQLVLCCSCYLCSCVTAAVTRSIETASNFVASADGTRLFVSTPQCVDAYNTKAPFDKVGDQGFSRLGGSGRRGAMCHATRQEQAFPADLCCPLDMQVASVAEPGVVLIALSPAGQYLITCQKPQKVEGEPVKNLKVGEGHRNSGALWINTRLKGHNLGMWMMQG